MSTLLSTNTNANDLQRQSANFDPSVWGDFFITYACDNKNAHEWCKEAKTLKENVRKMLVGDFRITEPIGEKISMIDVIQRLGIAHHFSVEIQEMLQRIFKLFNDDENNHEQYELTTLALLFRLLRQHGHNISCDIFNKFKGDQKDEFKEVITKDIEGMLSFYEATHLRVHGETILEKAFEFTKSALEIKVSYLKPSLAKHVKHTLRWPIRKCLPRLGAREFISFYQDIESHNEDLLKFAKLDFNLLQMKHIEELNAITKWWKDLDVKKNLPYARDRVTECYFWMLAIYYEPQYAVARKFAVKVISLTSLIDDTFDEYGTYEELELFTNAFERWDISAMDDIPEYMKIIYQTVLRTYDEMEELIKEERSYAISYAKQALKRVVKAYLDEAKWLVTKEMPSMEEYMSVAIPSSAYPHLTVATSVGIKEVASEDIFIWLSNDPPVLRSVARICRFMDDIVPHKGEILQGEGVPSALHCYMKQYNVSSSEAGDYLKNEVENAWNDINSAFLDPNLASSRSVLMNILGLARVMELLYSDEDIYTRSEKMKPYVASLLVNPLDI